MQVRVCDFVSLMSFSCIILLLFLLSFFRLRYWLDLTASKVAWSGLSINLFYYVYCVDVDDGLVWLMFSN